MVAPHPDDETLAAGGLIFDHVRAGWDVSIVVVTDGAASHPNVHDLRSIREQECVWAMRTLGVSNAPTFLRFPDGQAEDHIDEISGALQRALGGTDVVVGPRADDGHSDHRATADALEILANRASGPVVLQYAIWGWELLDDDRLNVDAAETFRPSEAAVDAKRLALGQYSSQTTDRYGQVIVHDALLRRLSSDTEVFWW